MNGVEKVRDMIANIYIVEDHPLMQQTMAEFLNRAPDLHVCGAVSTAQEALAELPTTQTDLVLIDLALPDKSGLELLRSLQHMLPNLRCLMFSSYQDAIYVHQALAAGACGYLFKGEPLELVNAIRQVLNGERYVPESFRRQMN